MSKKHPVVAVTGSSGAGTTTVKRAFEHIFLREGIKAERTACINRIRGLLLEFGVAVPTGSRALRVALDEITSETKYSISPRIRRPWRSDPARFTR